LDPPDLALDDRVDLCPLHVDRYAAACTVADKASPDEYAVGGRADLQWLHSQIGIGIDPTAEHARYRVKSEIGRGLWILAVGAVLGTPLPEVGNRVSFPSVEAVICRAHQIFDLLRHRPRSISLKTAALHTKQNYCFSSKALLRQPRGFEGFIRVLELFEV